MDHILLIDGKNVAYRALFAARGNSEFRRGGYHPFMVWLRFVYTWLEKFRPQSCHVFWDGPKREVWRKRVLAEYKEHRADSPHYTDEVQTQLRGLLDAAEAILPYMGVRQYYRAGQESDDLIYAACRALNPGKSGKHKLVVVSSDSDFRQLQWRMPYVACYLPKESQFAPYPQCDPAVQKALAGDRSDNIEGYRGIGPVKSAQLAADPAKLLEFLELVDRRKFRQNMAIIDLSMNPAVLSNQLYVWGVMNGPVQFDRGRIQQLSVEHHVRGMMSEYARVAVAFKRLV